jgi:alpha-amylase/alpha-mannosidase (GH57 family)
MAKSSSLLYHIKKGFKMERYVCIHGHFYQPPRENPWLEEVELQDLAYPYHDWNDRITEECYRQNAASRILGPDKKIIDIVNNYSQISFDFGPTLLSWLERHAADVYNSIIEADKKSREIFSGHGAAIAHAYNHIIMPLANTRDKRTQIIWGIRDFERRFGRKPEGMWLPETAVDLETLDILAEYDIKFTILAPHQARRMRQIKDGQWKIVERDKFDTTQPYLCRLPSGRTINLFFYHGPVASEVNSGTLLQNGEIFARKMAWIFTAKSEEPQLAHVAADGETYGHHHRYADMALAYCLHYIKSNNLAKITVYGEYLEKFPPTCEVEIYESSSWSCSHGIERWRSNCGCCYGRYPSGQQQWRTPLRQAMDWLRDRLASEYESKMAQFAPDPWKLRDEYLSVINNRTTETIENFISNFIHKELTFDEKVTFLKLMEMQRNALLMYTSCGWFFDDICGIEAVQIMLYAARAIQLAKETVNKDLEPEFENILEKAPTNTREFANGKAAYQSLVKIGSIDLNRVAVHLAISSIFTEKLDEKTDIYSYTAKTEIYDRVDAGIQSLATGRTTIQSNIVLEEYTVDFAVMYLGQTNLVCAAVGRMADDKFSSVQRDMRNAFLKGDAAGIMRLMNTVFNGSNYSLWHLFRDQQRHILYHMLETTWLEIEASFRHIYENNCTIMQVMHSMNIPLPKALSVPAEFILNQDLCKVIRDDETNLEKLQLLADEATRLSLQIDKPTLQFEASRKINRLMTRFESSPTDIELLQTIETTVKILLTIISEFNLQTAQNVFFAISKETCPQMSKKARMGDQAAQKWVGHFKNLAHCFGVTIQ